MSSNDNIKVMIRVRPFNQREISEGSRTTVYISEEVPHSIVLDSNSKPKVFSFDWTGDQGTNQQDIFNYIGRKMVDSCLEGYNSTIFAYGQTGAGKTFTMLGKGVLETEDPTSSDLRGLQPRCIEYLFWSCQRAKERNPDLEFLIKCSYLEIYNENIVDLLNNEAEGTKRLLIRETIKKGVYLEGIGEEETYNLKETMEVLTKGARKRTIGSTNMNVESSRSHSVFTIHVESKTSQNGVCKIRNSKFHFVDLAGSERQKKTDATGARLKEGCNINKSLSVLGSVINALVENSNSKKKRKKFHIRYRDSKLTHLLKDSLGGNSRTTMIANISPASSAYHETLSTLQFAVRAKMIKNNASINEDASGNVDSLKREISKLKNELESARGIIHTLETNPALAGGTFSKENIEEKKVAMLQENDSMIGLEQILLEAAHLLEKNQLVIEAEVGKKESYLLTFKKAMRIQWQNEMQLRSINKLYKARLGRAPMLSQIMKEALSTDDKELKLNNAFYTLQECYWSLKKEKETLQELVDMTPLVARVFEENVMLKHRIEALTNHSRTVTVGGAHGGKTLREERLLLEKMVRQVEENIDDRKKMGKRWQKMQLEVESGTEKELQEKERLIADLKIDFNQKISKLQSEINHYKQSEKQRERMDNHSSKQYRELERKLRQKDASHRKEVDSYLSRIELLMGEVELTNYQGGAEGEIEVEGDNSQKKVLGFTKLKDDLKKMELEVETFKDKAFLEKKLRIELESGQKVQEVKNETFVEKEEKLMMEIQELKKKLEYARDDMKVWNKERLDLIKSKKDLLSENERIKLSLKTTLQEEKKIQGELSEMEGKIFEEDSKSGKVELQEEISMLKLELQKEKSERGSDLDSIEYYKGEAEKARKDLITSRSRDQQERRERELEVRTELEARIRMLQEELKISEERKTKTSSRLDSGKKDREEHKKKRLIELEVENERLKHRGQLEREEFQKKNQEIEEFWKNELEEVKEVTQEKEKMYKGMLEDLRKTQGKKNSDLAASKSGINAFKSEISELRDLNKELEEERGKSIEMTNQMERELEQLQASKEALQGDMDSLKDQVLEIQESLNKTQKENNRLLEDMIDLKEASNNSKRLAVEAQRRMEHANKREGEHLLRSNKAVKERNLFQRQANQFFNHLMEIRSQLEGSSEIFDDLMSSHKLRLEVKMLRQEIDSKQRKLVETQSQVEDQYSQFKEDSEQILRYCQKLENNFSSMETTVALKEEEKSELKKQVEKFKGQMNKWRVMASPALRGGQDGLPGDKKGASICTNTRTTIVNRGEDHLEENKEHGVLKENKTTANTTITTSTQNSGMGVGGGGSIGLIAPEKKGSFKEKIGQDSIETIFRQLLEQEASYDHGKAPNKRENSQNKGNSDLDLLGQVKNIFQMKQNLIVQRGIDLENSQIQNGSLEQENKLLHKKIQSLEEMNEAWLLSDEDDRPNFLKKRNRSVVNEVGEAEFEREVKRIKEDEFQKRVLQEKNPSSLN